MEIDSERRQIIDELGSSSEASDEQISEENIDME
jgi:hypothetical protein